MIGYIDKIRAISQQLLTEGKVEMVIGFRRGTVPLMNEPCFIKKADDTDKLCWDSHCGINLANYLPNRREKIGIIAKGCDSRNIVTHIIENKIKRDQLVIIGVPCTGMVDKRRLVSMVKGEILSVSETADFITVAGNGFEQTVAIADILQQNCAVCVHRNPVIYDELAAELVQEQQVADIYQDVKRIESMTTIEKQQYFSDLTAACIRCYACRNACPLCYCPTCFVDESKPQWLGKTLDPIDTQTFHFLRAFHCAGRCTDCGACERACPMGINVRDFTRKLNKDCLELYGWEAGLTLEQRPPLDTYKLNDPESFIM